MKLKRKYIITYGGAYMEEIYGFACNLTEAKKFIADCMEENDIHISEVQCYEIKSKDISANIRIIIKE